MSTYRITRLVLKTAVVIYTFKPGGGDLGMGSRSIIPTDLSMPPAVAQVLHVCIEVVRKQAPRVCPHCFKKGLRQSPPLHLYFQDHAYLGISETSTYSHIHPPPLFYTILATL